MTWQKYLAILVGSHSEATAAVLAIFLGGLAVGYSLFGTVSRRLVARAARAARQPRLLYTYGLIEAGIGVNRGNAATAPRSTGSWQMAQWRSLARTLFSDRARTFRRSGSGSCPQIVNKLSIARSDDRRVGITQPNDCRSGDVAR